ncbi:MAG: hypothetical protein LIP28_09645 [Deltaproteobacteria bacterium]|nr:hypothetical protein [Deltaproteobacteria bacterium]
MSTSAILNDICDRNNVPCTVFASQNLAFCSKEDAELLGRVCGVNSVRCCLSEIVYSSYGCEDKDAVSHARELGETFAGELHQFVEESIAPGTVLFSHTVNAPMLWGYSLWLERLKKEPPRIVVNHISLPDDAADLEAHRLALEAASRHDALTIMGGSIPLCRLLEQYTGKHVGYMPTPMATSLPPRRREKDDTPVFCVAGEARCGKNFEILPRGIGRYLVGGGAGKFSIQLHRRDDSLDEVIGLLQALQEKFPLRIELNLQPFYGQEYYNHISRCDAILLPYPVWNYRTRPTFIIFEAAALGVSSIVQRGTSMEEELRSLNNGSVFMDGDSPAELTRAMEAFERNLEANRRAASDAAPVCRAAHNPQRYFSLIMGE